MIKTDFGSAKIADYSDGNREQTVVFTCEHSSKKLPAELSWAKGEESLEDQHWASDIGALDLATFLTKHYKTYLVYAEYSRLALDVNRVVVSKSMMRENLEADRKLSFNTSTSFPHFRHGH